MTLMGSVLLLLPAALQCWLVFTFLRRGLHRRFRFFFAYSSFDAAASLLKFAVLANYRIYFITYWAVEAVYSILGVLAIMEVFRHLLQSFSRAVEIRLAMWAGVLLMAVVSVVHAVFNPPVQAGRVITVIYSTVIAVGYIEIGLFVLFIAITSFYAIPWRKYDFGIVFGFGLLALSRLAAALLRSEFGMRFRFVFTWMPGMVYIVAVLIWIFVFLKPEPPDATEGAGSPLPPEEVIAGVKQLSKTLKGSAR